MISTHTVSSTVQEDAIDLILDEREYQDEKWGGSAFDLTNTPEDWCRYIRDYSSGAGRSAGYPFAKRMQKVAALGLAALEICIQKGEDPNDEIFEEPTPARGGVQRHRHRTRLPGRHEGRPRRTDRRAPEERG